MTIQVKFFMTTKTLGVIERDVNDWLVEADKKGWMIEDIQFTESPETKGYDPSTTVMVRFNDEKEES